MAELERLLRAPQARVGWQHVPSRAIREGLALVRNAPACSGVDLRRAAREWATTAFVLNVCDSRQADGQLIARLAMPVALPGRSQPKALALKS